MGELGIWNLANEDPSSVAVVEPDGTSHSRAEIATASNRLVAGLRDLGLARGDALATVLENSAPMIELILAAQQAGWVLTPINFHLTAPEIAYIVENCGAKALVCSSRTAQACSAAASEIRLPERARFVVGEAPGFRPYGDLKSGWPDALPEPRHAGTVMHYTAGTTGRPKGVRRQIADLDPDTVAEMYAWFLSLFGIEPEAGNVHLVVAPLYHTAVLQFCMNSLHMGHTVVLMDKWTPEGTLERIEQYRVTTSHMVPTQFNRLLQLPEAERAPFDVSSLRRVIHSAAPCPIDVKKRMLEWWGPVIYEYYAATEGGGTLVSAEEWLERPGTVGKPWPISEIRILDDDGTPVPTGEPGTVWIRMGEYTFEYHRDPEKTKAGWHEGFFTVGDVGYLDDAGYLFLCDRKADMIISGGVNIYPAEVEAALLAHPAVGDAAVFGIPDDDWGEQVKAVVEPRAGATPGLALADEIIAHCRERLAGYKCPRSLDFVEAMPRDPNGKVYKRTLRDPYWAGRERAI